MIATVVLRFVTALIMAVPSLAAAQIPDEFKNLQVFPEDISKAELVETMRQFSFALGVRCQHCHIGGDGISFEGVEFDKDGPAKENARFMVRMTRRLNEEILAEVPNRQTPPLRIECKTCHRGRPTPMLLTREMRRALDTNGVEAGIDRYRTLREEYEHAGAYDFREWEVNTLAEELEREGRARDAIAIYELNQEYFPESVSIAMALGRLYESIGDTEAAARNYETVLAVNPEHEGARARLDALR